LKVTARLGRVSVGDGSPVRIMAAINVSPESFYKGSVARPGQISASVRRAVGEGADVIDIGGASTAPYLHAGVSEAVETERVVGALREAAPELRAAPRVAVSVDTVRASVAEAALANGATVVNDVSGLKNDPAMARVVKDAGASLFAMAHSTAASKLGPIALVTRSLKETLRLAGEAGIDERLIVVDPGIGFFRDEKAGRTASRQTVMPWYEWDCAVISNLRRLRSLGRPLGVGLSRKSFLGRILGLEAPDDRLAGSLAVTGVAVMNGAKLIRTHDVVPTLHAVRAVEAVMAGSLRGGRST
jgi:dihydropteroate synthase